jgi:hypothetical protein
MTLKEKESLVIRYGKVITSCTSFEQLNCAEKYSKLALAKLKKYLPLSVYNQLHFICEQRLKTQYEYLDNLNLLDHNFNKELRSKVGFELYDLNKKIYKEL